VFFTHGGEYLQIEDVCIRSLRGLQFQFPSAAAEFIRKPFVVIALLMRPFDKVTYK
jgi:predicted HD phosphohydrolase